MASRDYEPRIIHPAPGEEVWVQSKEGNIYELGVQLDSEQYTWLDLERWQLELVRDNINAALAET